MGKVLRFPHSRAQRPDLSEKGPCLPVIFRQALLALFLTEAAAAAGQQADYPLQPVPFTAVCVADGFWAPRIETNRKTTVWYDFKQCEDTGRIDNFVKAAGLMPGEFRGVPWDDSDVYKIIEIGLARLYRATGKEQYLKLAKYLLDIRGRAATHALYGAQQQDHLPVLEQTRYQYNKVTFAPVTTDALRVEAQLQPGFSSGVLEWKTDE